LRTTHETLIFYISLKDEKLIFKKKIYFFFKKRRSALERLHLALGGCGQILKRNDYFIFRVQDSLSINDLGRRKAAKGVGGSFICEPRQRFGYKTCFKKTTLR
jgi:hypothetical protein